MEMRGPDFRSGATPCCCICFLCGSPNANQTANGEDSPRDSIRSPHFHAGLRALCALRFPVYWLSLDLYGSAGISSGTGSPSIRRCFSRRSLAARSSSFFCLRSISFESLMGSSSPVVFLSVMTHPLALPLLFLRSPRQQRAGKQRGFAAMLSRDANQTSNGEVSLRD